MLTLDEALAILLDGVPLVPAEDAAIGQCAGRILAADVHATRDQPPAAVSAMDGYAVRVEDALAGAQLRIVGESPAGAPFAGSVGRGQCVRIATGGVVPDGTDAILIQENAERHPDFIRVSHAPARDQYIRAAGLDFRAGERIASAREALTPARLGVLAAANLGTVPVRANPVVSIIPSGDELREPGAELTSGMIANSAAYVLEALVSSWGGVAVRQAILPDDRGACGAQLEAVLDADVIVPIGGASVGDRDVLRPLFADLVAETRYAGIAVQPGKPSWHARFPDGRMVLGLPGNPASAFVCAHLLLKPLLYALTGRDPRDARKVLTARLDAELPRNGAREQYFRAILGFSADGKLSATPDARQDSSLLTPLAAANGLIRQRADAPAAGDGEKVEVLPFGPFA